MMINILISFDWSKRKKKKGSFNEVIWQGFLSAAHLIPNHFPAPHISGIFLDKVSYAISFCILQLN